MNPWDLSLTGLQRQLREKKLSASEVTEALIGRICENDDRYNCFITTTFTAAREQARRAQELLDRDEDCPELTGVPMAVKDNICTRGITTTCASRMLKDFVPEYSATAYERLLSQNAVLLGKLNLDEFAMGGSNETSCFGPVRNPWNIDYAAGGSSGGSAAAVAAGECFYALGSDTGGSVRLPAAHCGVVGVKPTYGAVSRYGLVAHASSLDQIGVLARDVLGAAAVLRAIMGRDERDATSVRTPPLCLEEVRKGKVKGMRMCIPRELFGKELSHQVKERVMAAAVLLKSLGAQVDVVSLSEVRYAIPAYFVLSTAQACSNLARYDGIRYGHRPGAGETLEEFYVKSRTEGFGLEVKGRLMLGAFVLKEGESHEYYVRALQVRKLLQEHFQKLFETYDVMLTPTSTRTAPKIGASEGPLKLVEEDSCTVLASLTGLPALSVPCGFEEGGLPVGMQLIGRAFEEEALLSLACAYEQAAGFLDKRPQEAGKGGKRLCLLKR